MAKITRRSALRTLGITSVVAQMACHEKCPDLDESAKKTFELMHVLFSIIYLTKYEQDIAPHVKPILPMAVIARMQANGSPSSSVAGSAPTTGGRNAAAVSRAWYVVDALGDANVDAQVYAVSLGDDMTLRGSVTLRTAVPGASALSLPDIALSSDGARLLVCQAGAPPEWIFIDAASLTISGRLTPPAGIFPRQAVFSPDGKLAYTFSSDRQFDETAQRFTVHVLDTSSRTVLNSLALPAGTAIDDIALTPDGALLFAVGNRLVHIIDTSTLTYSGQNDIVTPSGPFVSGNARRLVMHPDGDKLYTVITRFPSGSTVPVVAAIDTRTGQVVSEWPLKYPTGGTAPRIALTPDGTTLGAGFQRGPELQIYNTTSGEPEPSIVFSISGNPSFAEVVSV